VVERGQARLVVVLEVGRIERMEQYLQELMLAVVVGGTLLSAWLGWLLAARSIRPVRELALSVEALPDRPAPTGLASRYGADEVGRLAAAIDGFQRRLSTADDRERQFFADASHELRTPITVIQGAVEVLEDDPLASADQRQKFARIERSVFELASLIEAVLLSARKLPDEHSPIDLASLCREVLATLEGRHPGLAARLRVVGAGPTALHGPLRWATSLLTVLFHRVLTAFPDARWIAELSDEGLLLRQAPGGAAGGAPAVVRSDLGIGLVFADRLARVLGWRLHQDTGSEDGLRLRLSV
jgi:signal transduction histidine kinase